MEMLNKATGYLEELANGNDPFTGESLPEDTVLNNLELSRSFFFVMGILQEVIDNGGMVKRVVRRSRMPFVISEEEKGEIELTDAPINISTFCENINRVVDPEKSGKLKVTAFGKWLMNKGLLTVEVDNGERNKKATEAGVELGIESEWRTYGDRQYYATSYNKEAQQFLLDNLDEITAISNG